MAAEEITERGLGFTGEAFSRVRIARLAGVHRSTVYSVFPDGDDLARDLLSLATMPGRSSSTDDRVRGVFDGLDRNDSLSMLFVATALNAWKDAREDPVMRLQMYFWATGGSDAAVRDALRSMYGDICERLESACSAALEAHGRRLRAGVSTSDFVAITVSLVEGFAIRTSIDEPVQEGAFALYLARSIAGLLEPIGTGASGSTASATASG